MFRRKTAFILLTSLCLATTVLAQGPKWKTLEAQGDTLYDKQDFAGAVKMYNRILDANKPVDGRFEDSDLYSVLYKRAVCLYTLQEYQLALKDLELFAPVFPRAPQPKLLKAYIYRELDDLDNQLKYLEAAMELQPPNAEFLKWRGMLYLQKNDFTRAMKDVRAARTLQDDSEVETYLGVCYFNVGKKDSAYVSFNKAIEMDATYPTSYLYAGSVSMQDANYSLAIEYLDLVLRLDTRNKEALFYKGVSLVELKRLDEGCRCLNKAFYAGFDDASDYLTEFCYQVEN